MAIESMMLWAAGGSYCQRRFKERRGGLWGCNPGGDSGWIDYQLCSFTGKADLYLTNIAMNLAAAGGTVFVLFLASGDKSNSAGSIQSMVLPVVNLPFIKDIPVLGRIVSGHNILTYGAFAAAF